MVRVTTTLRFLAKVDQRSALPPAVEVSSGVVLRHQALQEGALVVLAATTQIIHLAGACLALRQSQHLVILQGVDFSVAQTQEDLALQITNPQMPLEQVLPLVKTM